MGQMTTSCEHVNRLTPNDPYMFRTASLTSKRCILYIYSTNIGIEYCKRALYSPFFSLQNTVCFIMLTCLVPVLSTFYTQGVLKLKKKIFLRRRLNGPSGSHKMRRIFRIAEEYLLKGLVSWIVSWLVR